MTKTDTSASSTGPGWAVLTAIMLPVWLAAVDTAIANTALPALASDLGVSPAQSVWIVNAYQVAVVACLLPLAALGQRWGERPIFLLGVLLFTLASLACSLSGSLPALTASRMLQGMGAAGIMTVNLALVRRIYPAHQLGRGVGLNAFVVGIGYTSGPTLASLVLSVGSWPWLFAINVPMCAVAVWLGWRHLPQPKLGHKAAQPPFDGALAAVLAFTLASAALTLNHGAQRNDWATTGGFGLIGLIGSVWIARRQRGHPHLMWPSDLLKKPAFALSVATSLSAFTTQGLAFVGLPFFLEEHLRRDAMETGFLLSTWALTVALTGPWAGRLSDRVRPAVLGSSGLLLLAVGMGLLASLRADASALDVMWRMAWCGLGFGLFQSPNLKAIMSSTPPERNSGGSAIIALARLSGQTLGASLVALCFAWLSLQGSQAALWLGCLTASLAAAFSSLRLRFDAHMSPKS